MQVVISNYFLFYHVTPLIIHTVAAFSSKQDSSIFCVIERVIALSSSVYVISLQNIQSTIRNIKKNQSEPMVTRQI